MSVQRRHALFTDVFYVEERKPRLCDLVFSVYL